jgi:hypothetical protein
MNYAQFRKLTSVATLVMFMFAVTALVYAQYGSTSKAQVSSQAEKPSLTATLVDPEKKAAQKAATVSVTVTGIKLIDPGEVNEKPNPGQGHLHYQVDSGPVIATPAMKLSFHGLTSGAHKIVVMLAGNDHNPLGPQQTLDVTIP